MRILGGVFALAIGLGLGAPANASINYNASKSNTLGSSVSKQLKCRKARSHMAVKGCGVPKNNAGMVMGRRIHRPVQ
ncbi:hypothetical protein LGH82_23510 [Mesorhizobium sp. PAMC28654]|uniref:hypothetical protein n=1 Tax=Mesorhizobium sp. PAMC28654 TaxID=2880934 RepID=UPI001D09B929|nr:hypothetical protein [Mesorhizobium sp. PAMC28654]UDL88105.1 hypothetical protein LGH82_23510 [Mesorhizobium sp. PAMC28654]